MSHRLIIVESPTKAKTIKHILGASFEVLSSFGHVRDLPKSKMGVDVEHGFKPTYIVSPDKKAKVAALKDAAKTADEILLATDDDREGEAIAWHIAELLDIKESKAKRVVFHEITKKAVETAMEHPRGLDTKLVDAQQARRILDRLVGYELSPFLWKKVARGLSAGRVQSVAMRFVVERERERQAFKAEEYWSLDAEFSKDSAKFPAMLSLYKGEKIAKMTITGEARAKEIMETMKNGSYSVTDIESKKVKRSPKPPYTTSTLQQDANTKLGFTAKQTMKIAQELYEGVKIGNEGHTGLITYMRTDSLNLSPEFLSSALSYVKTTFGEKFAEKSPRVFKTSSKGAQEAHEAIRPSEATRTPDSIRAYLSPQQFKLYDLIWRRALSTQMTPAILNRLKVTISSADGAFSANGSSIAFEGFLKLYPDSAKEVILPEMKKDDIVKLEALTPNQHFTEPPPRYSDATLVKAMEEHGIGRPSTYAPTIATITDRGYVERDENKRLAPTAIAFAVNDLLVEHFANIVDKEFTADMEQKFDDIAEGKEKWREVIEGFYTPFHANLEKMDKVVDKKELMEEKTDKVCEKCGNPMVIKLGRFGKFMACSNYPECKTTIRLNTDGTIAVAVEAKMLGTDPKSGLPVLLQRGRFGPYVQLGETSEDKKTPKPKRSSLLRGMTPDTLTLEQALQLLSLPRELGEWNGEIIKAQVGRFGPYVSAGKESRSISVKAPFTVLTITPEQATALLNTPKKTRKPKS
ncbi:MAG: type I DNA topoisomerase [Patescibacteria group bacterium]